MPGVELKGSCHCGTVRYSVMSSTAVPYQLCVCSVCRKVGGVGGSINLGGHSKTLKILQGKEYISIYNAVLYRGTDKERVANSERNFCSKCSAMLWLYDSEWPDYIHPFASSVDSPELQVPEEMNVVLLEDKPAYVRLPEGKKQTYEHYGPHSLEEWHKIHKCYVE